MGTGGNPKNAYKSNAATTKQQGGGGVAQGQRMSNLQPNGATTQFQQPPTIYNGPACISPMYMHTDNGGQQWQPQQQQALQQQQQQQFANMTGYNPVPMEFMGNVQQNMNGNVLGHNF